MVNPALLVAVPLGLAFAIPLFGLISRRIVGYIPIVASACNLVIALSLIARVQDRPVVIDIGGFPPPFCINIVAGPVGTLFAALIALAGFIVAMYALAYIKEGAQEEYHILYLMLLTAATGIVLTGDIFNLFVFFEILCISSYALVAYWGDRPSIESAIKYLIQGALGSSFLLIGIGILYGLFGTLNMAHIAQHIDSISPIAVFVSMAFMVSGLGIEAAIFPLNAWLPDAHSSAPSSISAILSGIAIEVGLYAVIRVLFTIFNAGSTFMFFMFLGVLTLLIGEMCAFSQNNVKRMLAYSSIGQIGLILFAFAVASTYSVTGGMFQMVSHTLGKGLLFLAVGYMIYRSGSMEISSLRGMSDRMPLTSFAFTIGAFSIVGLPPFAGFPSKFLIVRAALAQEEILFTVLIGLVLLGTIIEGAYFFRVIQVIYFQKGESRVRDEAPLAALVSMFLFVIAIVGIGIYPQFVTTFLGSAASELLGRLDYIRNILG